MNRASLLHILDNVTGITEAEVRELEQLATAFPYCQTAHLLLAKAAHDRGSMLAGQRLRRAATYAADRELLRLLIETPAGTLLPSSEPAAQVSSSVAMPEVSEPQRVEAELQSTEALPFAEPEPAAVAPGQVEPFQAPAFDPELTEAEAYPVAESVASTADLSVEAADDELIAEPAAEEAPATATEPTEQFLGVLIENTVEEPALVEEEQPASHLEEVAAADSPNDESVTELTSVDTDAESQPESVVEAATLELLLTSEPVDVAEASEPEDGSELGLTPTFSASEGLVAGELPPLAPPIRPPVEAGSSRFEFGLAEAAEQAPLYQLPEFEEEEEPKPGAIPAFRADEHLAYAVAAGSRFGYALTLRDAELTFNLPLADSWHPDAAHQAHLSAHRPSVAALPSSLVLIERFLRSQPRIKTATVRPSPTDEPQTDLSVRSTSAPPSLASESLAKIMVKQGKIARAIEIYEQLMQRQPEKKAYFAAQIDLLNQQTE
ncbi:hypothetical protein [Solirubrum puertoriconensis]|uniref:Uncharacterized protein n=1 Tax=Solirubrum puertoriconensis TaxID=1751427 RepID=A0A9X0HMQ1_SOLP1|nr:hypothetical protein [Solirubrum puertoriconensis]KUG08815.1 hypothetical protein ASU33_11850 [Solirubrum puertoriconensis]